MARFSSEGTADPSHVRPEQWVLPVLYALDGDVEQRSDEAVELVLGAVVCVQAAFSVWDERTLMAG
jgi:hypothetical protein